jgi:hypothetical protein
VHVKQLPVRDVVVCSDAEVITVPAFTGAPEQLWRIDQLTDGNYRIMPKVVPNSNKKLHWRLPEIAFLHWQNLILIAIILNGILKHPKFCQAIVAIFNQRYGLSVCCQRCGQ